MKASKRTLAVIRDLESMLRSSEEIAQEYREYDGTGSLSADSTRAEVAYFNGRSGGLEYALQVLKGTNGTLEG